MSNAPQIILNGDAAAALPYVPFAKQKLAALRALGLRFANKVFFINDVEIVIKVNPFQDKIFLTATGNACPAIQYDGFLDTWPAQASYTYGQSAYLAAQQQAQEAPVNNIPMMYGMRKFPAPNPLVPPDKYPKVAVPQQTDDENFRLFFEQHKPTRYSGIMRKVLQCTFATKSWRDSLTYKTVDNQGTQYHFNLNYQFGDSWGIVLAPGTDGSKGEHYFLIWISMAEVFYVPAKFCVHTKVGTANVPILQAIHRTKAISLGTIPSLGGSSCSQPVGWAFSYTQQKASIVIFGDDGHSRVTVKLVTIGFNFSSGIPITITVTMGTANVFWAPIDGHSTQGVFQVPTQKPFAVEGVLVNTTLQVRDQFVTPNPMNYRVSNIPVHVYYLPNTDAPETVDFSYIEIPAGPAITNTGMPQSDAAISPGWGTDAGDGSCTIWGFTKSGALPSIRGPRSKNWNTAALINTTIGGGSAYGETWFIQANSPAGWVAVVGAQQVERSDLVITNRAEVGGAGTMFGSCTLPVDDRECALLYNVATIAAATTDTTTITQSNTGRRSIRTRAGAPMIDEWGATYSIGSHPPISSFVATATGAGYVVTGTTPYQSLIAYPNTGTPQGDSLQLDAGSMFQVSVTNNANSGTSNTTAVIYAAHDPVALDGSQWSSWLAKLLSSDDNFVVKHSSSSFAPSTFYKYDSAPNTPVVKMGAEVYTPASALTGWLGVV